LVRDSVDHDVGTLVLVRNDLQMISESIESELELVYGQLFLLLLLRLFRSTDLIFRDGIER